jgi:Restriction endonuclease S subunits
MMKSYKMVELGSLIHQAKTVRCGDGDYPVLSMTMHDGLVFQDDKFKKVIASKDRSDYKVVFRNQLVISFPIDEGVLAAQRIVDAGIVSPAYGIWDIDQAQILPEFLEYSLRCVRALNYYKAKLRGSTARRRSLPTPTLLEFTVPLPSKEEQNEILSIIHHAKEVCSLRQQELQKLDELIKARFVEMFENGQFPIHTVENLCSEVVDCPHTTPKYEGELKNPAIRTSEIKKGYLTWDSMKYVSDDEYEERVVRLRPEQGDIVYGREGTFGNAAILPAGYKFCLGQRVMLLRPDYSLCTSEYMLHAVISDSVYRQALEKNNASTVAHVNVKDVKQFRIPLPPIELQNQFADFVKQLDKSKVVVQKALNEAQLLFDSLMQQYFG